MKLPCLFQPRILKQALTALFTRPYTTKFPAEPFEPIDSYRGRPRFDPDACIGCGACVAACPNASAMLFMSAKVGHLGYLPQGQPERYERVLDMVQVHDDEGFGNCTNHGACQNACPKGISVDFISRLNRDLVKATLTYKPYEITAV